MDAPFGGLGQCFRNRSTAGSDRHCGNSDVSVKRDVICTSNERPKCPPSSLVSCVTLTSEVYPRDLGCSPTNSGDLEIVAGVQHPVCAMGLEQNTDAAICALSPFALCAEIELKGSRIHQSPLLIPKILLSEPAHCLFLRKALQRSFSKTSRMTWDVCGWH